MFLWLVFGKINHSPCMHAAVIPEQMTNRDGAYVFYFNRGFSFLNFTLTQELVVKLCYLKKRQNV